MKLKLLAKFKTPFWKFFNMLCRLPISGTFQSVVLRGQFFIVTTGDNTMLIQFFHLFFRFRKLCIAWIVDLVELANNSEKNVASKVDFDSVVETLLPLCKSQKFPSNPKKIW